MPNIESFELKDSNKYRVWFKSSDHRPPHFHLKPNSNDWEVAINIHESIGALDFRYVFQRSGEFRQGLQTEVLREIQTNREALLAEWEEKVVESDNYSQPLGDPR